MHKYCIIIIIIGIYIESEYSKYMWNPGNKFDI